MSGVRVPPPALSQPKREPVADRSALVWDGKESQVILLTAGIAAWLIAIGLTLYSQAEVVAAAFATVGFPLLGGAALYPRLHKLGPEGMEMRPYLWKEAMRELDERSPPSEEVSAPSERAALFEMFENLNDAWSQAPEPEPAPKVDTSLWHPLIDFSVQRYEGALNLERAARDWFEAQGGTILSNARAAGVDFIVRHGQDAEAVEVKSSRGGAGAPTPEFLRDRFLKARIWVDEHLGQDGRFLCTLVTDVVPPPPLRDRFREQGLGIVYIDPDTNAVNLILKPRNRRE